MATLNLVFSDSILTCPLRTTFRLGEHHNVINRTCPIKRASGIKTVPLYSIWLGGLPLRVGITHTHTLSAQVEAQYLPHQSGLVHADIETIRRM